MSPKEVRVTCPRCAARLDVDVRSAQVVRSKPPDAPATSAPEETAERGWDAALQRAAGRRSGGEQRFEQALNKERTREQELERLFAAAHGKLEASPEEPSQAGPRARGLTPERAEAALVEAWSEALGGPTMGPLHLWTAQHWVLWQGSQDPDAFEQALSAPQLCRAACLPASGPRGEATIRALARQGFQLLGFEPVYRLELALAGGPDLSSDLREIQPAERAAWLAAVGDFSGPNAASPRPASQLLVGAWRAFWLGLPAGEPQALALWIREDLAVLGPVPRGPAGEPGWPAALDAARRAAAALGSRWLLAIGPDPAPDPGSMQHAGWELAYHRALFARPSGA